VDVIAVLEQAKVPRPMAARKMRGCRVTERMGWLIIQS
jgi:hypothetical protein